MDPSRLFSNQRGRLPAKLAVALADSILKTEKKRLPVNIIFTDDDFLKDLNSRFRNKNRPTDVLSFTADADLGVLGDIYISIDTARCQAKEYRTTLADEILRLVAHGVLHLCGYDHQRKSKAREMENKTERYLKRFIIHV
ncbi:MAG: rRNA maturation RNase YbeY [FCB group bacterium]|nr:rRNA maturation RNase YbeY [FCB group bacterium]